MCVEAPFWEMLALSCGRGSVQRWYTWAGVRPKESQKEKKNKNKKKQRKGEKMREKMVTIDFSKMEGV